MKSKTVLLPALLLAGLAKAQTVSHSSYLAKSPDSVVIQASTRYDASFLRKIFTGANYREVWLTPVKMPVFDLEKSGMVITKMGGGQQTKSLRLKDKEGREWALRTVDKFVEEALPKGLRNTLAERVVQDMVSASHPYAALPVSALAVAGGILAPHPKLYYVPDSEALGPYRKDMAGKVCFLEERNPIPNLDDTEDTEDLIEKKIEEHDNLVLQRQVLKARLLDMLIADWDRHEDQWAWGELDSAGSNYYYAIPRDRDQAFFISGGLIPRLGKLFGMRHINHFKDDSRNIKDLSFKSWNFDKMFLNDLDAAEWEHIINEMVSKWNDRVIEDAVKTLPAEVYAIDGAELTEKLKSRRDGLKKNAMKYYRFLTARTTIAGTNENEFFNITGSGDNIIVTVFRLDKKGKPGKKIYERSFLPSETSQITLCGLDGNDSFLMDKSVNSRIKMKIYGDQGKDTYDLPGKARTTVYDDDMNKNNLLQKGNAKIEVDEALGKEEK